MTHVMQTLQTEILSLAAQAPSPDSSLSSGGDEGRNAVDDMKINPHATCSRTTTKPGRKLRNKLQVSQNLIPIQVNSFFPSETKKSSATPLM